ncbi:hypothetical protein KC19_7G043400 [Ceratodon purpureus]|uniref:Uncharacterized protein n=1 Tax=Ceratodon purpureus TaxID=3225 RepID=A0A8T0H626_CERPU|nr:hypothetical protein KC19_7G043400 [Ceratodon purpureus]
MEEMASSLENWYSWAPKKKERRRPIRKRHHLCQRDRNVT